MAGQLVMRNTFWELEVGPDELQLTVQERRQRAYTDMCFGSNFKSSDLGSFTTTDLGSPTSTDMGSSSPVSSGSAAGDASSRWADICDSDDETPSPSLKPSLPPLPSRPEGTWFSPQTPPSRPAGTWFLPPASNTLETQMAAAMGKAKERAAVEAKARGRVQTFEKQPAPKAMCEANERTTLVLRKLPKTVTRVSLLEMLDTAGMQGLYDFVYLPVDFKKGKVFGYAIVNFITNRHAEQASFHFEAAGVNIDWSDSHQGFDELIQRYRDSPIMHPSNPETSKPLIFSNGWKVPFPGPTKKFPPLPRN